MEQKSINLLDIILAKAMVGDATAAAARAKEYAEAAQEYAESIDPSKFATLAALETGAVIPAKALAAKTLENVSENSGSTQTTPFFFQATGTNNNTDATPTAPIAKQLEVRGNTVCVNQLLNPADFAASDTDFIDGVKITNNADGSVTINVAEGGATASRFYNLHSTRWTFPAHTIYGGQTPANIALCNTYSAATTVFSNAIYKNTYTAVQAFRPAIWIKSGCAAGTYTIYPKLYDLTLWYGSESAIPAYLLEHPEWFANCYDGELTYGTGALESADADELTTVGKNAWDEEWESGTINANGQDSPNANLIRSKGYTKVFPSTAYYYKSTTNNPIFFYDESKNFISRSYRQNNTFTTPSNCRYIRFAFDSSYGTTYKNDITINLHWDGEIDGQHFPYWSKTYPITWTRQPKSAGSAYDYKTSDGTEHYRIGAVDMGTLNWGRYAAGDIHYFATAIVGKAQGKTNLICPKYSCDNVAVASLPDKSISGDNSNSGICVRDDSYTSAADFKAAMSDVMLYYELTTEEVVNGEPFAEEVEVDDYGTMAFNSVVPQGCRFFYPADYALLIDDLNNYTEGDVTNLALKSDIKNFYQHNLDILLSGDFSTTHVYMSYVSNSATPITLVDIGTTGNPVTGKPYSATAVAIVNPIGAITFGTSPDATLTYLDGTTVSVEIASITDNVG